MYRNAVWSTDITRMFAIFLGGKGARARGEVMPEYYKVQSITSYDNILILSVVKFNFT